MKPEDPGYRKRMKWFKRLHCKHYLDGSNPIENGCPFRVRIVASSDEPIECPHQTGWHCINPKHPGNIKLVDLVIEAL